MVAEEAAAVAPQVEHQRDRRGAIRPGPLDQHGQLRGKDAGAGVERAGASAEQPTVAEQPPVAAPAVEAKRRKVGKQQASSVVTYGFAKELLLPISVDSR